MYHNLLTLAFVLVQVGSTLAIAQRSRSSYTGKTGQRWPGAGRRVSPPYPWLFQYELPLPPAAGPLHSLNINGTPVDYYELTVDKFQKQIYPNLGPANLAGYNGVSPGPTFRVPVGTENVVRLTNHNDLSSSMHLHGAWSRAPWDGWAADMVQPGQFKDYYYSGSQDARTLWYHDHADHHTSVDAYFGQAGFHIIYDPAEDALGLPQGKYDIPLAIQDKIYQPNGDLVSPASETINWFGDIIHVNGQPWPFLSVEPRKYRLRILNGALSRPFNLYFGNAQGDAQPFQVVGSDGGLFSAPVTTDNIDLSMGERYEVVFDFAPFRNQNITLSNAMRLPDIFEYNNTDRVMRFVVGNTVTDTTANSVPSTLRGQSNLAQQPKGAATTNRVFNFQRNGRDWTINGVTYDDVNARVLARPPMGTVETWTLRWASGPGTHPVHVHLIDFKILSRTGGRRAVLPYESAGLKDVVFLQPGETVEIQAIYGPWNGLYQFHCHNLIHEDHEMMDVLNVTALEGKGYDVGDVLSFGDPEDKRFLPRDMESKYYEARYIRETLVPRLVGSDAYRKLDQLRRIEGA